jgi:hypothetical protein
VAVAALAVAAAMTLGLWFAFAPHGLLELADSGPAADPSAECARVMRGHYAAVQRRDWSAALSSWDIGGSARERAASVAQVLEDTAQRYGDLQDARQGRLTLERAWGAETCRVIYDVRYTLGSRTEIFHLRRREGDATFQISQYCLGCPADLEAQSPTATVP